MAGVVIKHNILCVYNYYVVNNAYHFQNIELVVSKHVSNQALKLVKSKKKKSLKDHSLLK